MHVRLLCVIAVAVAITLGGHHVSRPALLCLAALLTLHYCRERASVLHFAREATRGCHDRMTKVLAVAGRVYSGVPMVSDPIFVPIPGLAVLGASPGWVLNCGGCCSGKTRLLVVTLRTLGISAHQIALYHSSGSAQHALVEVRLSDQHFIVDPTYGFYYVDERGAPIGTRELREGTRPRFRPIPSGRHSGYPPVDYFNFEYPATRTANWTKSWCRRVGYRMISALVGRRVDRAAMPWFLEWPQLVLAAFMIALVAGHIVAFR